MRARDVLKLKAGDIITCKECPEQGCDGEPAEVEVTHEPCGCVFYKHDRNECNFFVVGHKSCGAYEGWNSRNADGERISGRTIKLVRRKE